MAWRSHAAGMPVRTCCGRSGEKDSLRLTVLSRDVFAPGSSGRLASAETTSERRIEPPVLD